MNISLKRLADQVIVITGASSGIGLATARMAARQGARVIVAARSDEPLGTLVEEIRGAGGHAFSVEADVSREEDIRRIGDTALRHFGRFDTWVNNAGVSVYGEILDVPVQDERKLFDINFWGTVYGSRTALEHLKTRGGALINIGSVASDTAIPLQGAYCASKHAVKAYTDTLRMELHKAGAPVAVTLIKPTAIDTPFFQHAKTYMGGAQPTEPSPMYTPEEVARAILYAAENPVRDLLVGDVAPLQSFMGRYAPGLGDAYMKSTMFDAQKSQRQPGPHDNRGLDEASGDLRERGGVYDAAVFEQSMYTRAAMHPVLASTIGVGAGLALMMWLGATGKESRSRQ